MRLRLYHHSEHASVEVTLSRRNLLALLHKLEMPGSARTLISEDCPQGVGLVVRAEDDDDHYSGRAEGPGPMHPRTEAFIHERGREAGEDAKAGDGQDIDGQELPAGIERPDPGHFRHQILHQDQVWFDRFGRLHRLDQMPLDYLFNVIGFLERQAPALFLAEHLVEIHAVLSDTFDDQTASVCDFDDPVEWLRTTQLVQALAEAAEARLANGGRTD